MLLQRNHIRATVRRRGMSLLELLASVSILSVLVMVIVPRLGNGGSVAKQTSCEVQCGVIELQAAMWNRAKSGWPNSDLTDIGRDLTYFPEGLPVCPIDGTAYTIDENGKIKGHNHK